MCLIDVKICGDIYTFIYIYSSPHEKIIVEFINMLYIFFVYIKKRTVDSLTVQDKRGTNEQLSLNKKTQLWIIQVTTQY